MGDRTVPERINQFLVRCGGRPYCDHCIQERLGLRWRQQVQLVTATLAVTSEYRRNMATCCTCGDAKQVITFLGTAGAVRAGQTLSLPGMVRPAEAQLRPAAESLGCGLVASSARSSGSPSGVPVLAGAGSSGPET
jgi:hypothetical protein